MGILLFVVAYLAFYLVDRGYVALGVVVALADLAAGLYVWKSGE